jgi:hypothetical protein
MHPLHQAHSLLVGRLADHHPGGQSAAERLAPGRELGPAAPPPADRALPVPDQHPRHRPRPLISCHHPANRSFALRDGISTADSHRE